MVFQIIAVIILISFYGCYFIKMASQRKKGIQTNMLGKGKTGFIRFIEISLKVITIIVPIIETVSIFFNKNNLPLWAQITGAVLGICGVIIFIISVLEMKDSWRAGVPDKDETKLVTNGIYRFSRNPAFLGFDLVYIGIVFMYFNWVLYTLTLLAILMLHLQIVNVEEDYLLITFGDEYLQYRKKVCRYFGRKPSKNK